MEKKAQFGTFIWYGFIQQLKALLGRITGDDHILQPLPLEGLPVPLDHDIIRPNGIQ